KKRLRFTSASKRYSCGGVRCRASRARPKCGVAGQNLRAVTNHCAMSKRLGWAGSQYQDELSAEVAVQSTSLAQQKYLTYQTGSARASAFPSTTSGRGASSNLRRQAQGFKSPRAHLIFAAVPVVAIGNIWRPTNQEPLANQKIRRSIDIPGIFAPDPHGLDW